MVIRKVFASCARVTTMRCAASVVPRAGCMEDAFSTSSCRDLVFMRSQQACNARGSSSALLGRSVVKHATFDGWRRWMSAGKAETNQTGSSDFAFPINLAKPGDNPREFYERMVKEGKIRQDDRQLAALKQLETVWLALEQANTGGGGGGAGGGGVFFSSFFGGGSAEVQEGPKGLYMFGGVGCGKTFIMDIFFACARVSKKRRTHFHAFMLEVHERMHQIRKSGQGRADVATVAEQIVARDGTLFCFDEFNVTDVGDAVILRGLMDTMWDKGAVLVSTSNRHPKDLYKNGIQRDLFVPCITRLQTRCHVFDLDSSVDFRLLMTPELSKYIVTASDATREAEAEVELDKWFQKLAHSVHPRTMTLQTQGRKIKVKQTAAGVASFEFDELCGEARGASDFLALARAFHTVILHNIPSLSLQRLPEVRRLITLIDVLYDHKVKLMCSAAAEPFKLFIADKGAAQDEAFAFDRTASRLQDMMSEEYMMKMHSPPATLADSDTPHSLQERVSRAPIAELHHELTEKEVNDIWNVYDHSADGVLSPAEVREMLGDLSFLKKGHRNVRDCVFEEAFQSLDANKDGKITKDEFINYARRTGVHMWYIV